MAVLYNNIEALGTTIVATGPVDLIAVVVNTAAATSVVSVFDGQNLTTSALPKVATIDGGTVGNFFYGCILRNGLTVTMATAAAKITVIYDEYIFDPKVEDTTGYPPYVNLP